MAVRNGWVSQRKATEREILKATPLTINDHEPAGKQLAPLRSARSVSIRELSKWSGVSARTLENYFSRKGIEATRVEREEDVAAFALLDAVNDGLLPASCANWVNDEVRKRHKKSIDELKLKNLMK